MSNADGRPTDPAQPARATARPGYRAPADAGTPRLGRGIVWSDLVREMELEHEVRLRARALAAGAAVELHPRPGTDHGTGIGEAA